MTRVHKLFLNWLLTFSLIFFFFYILYDNNIIQHLLSADRSYITTIIFSAFFIISMHCGFYTFLVSCELNKAHIIKKNLLKDDVKLRLIDDHIILSSKGEMSDGIVTQYFKDLINHYEVRTPLDLHNEVGLTEGNIFQVELTMDQLMFNRPVTGYAQYRTPLKNMYMCSSSTHPGGGVMGAPGANAARELLLDMNIPQKGNYY